MLDLIMDLIYLRDDAIYELNYIAYENVENESSDICAMYDLFLAMGEDIFKQCTRFGLYHRDRLPYRLSHTWPGKLFIERVDVEPLKPLDALDAKFAY